MLIKVVLEKDRIILIPENRTFKEGGEQMKFYTKEESLPDPVKSWLLRYVNDK